MDTRTGMLIQPDDAEEIKELYPNLYETFKTGLRSTMSVPLISMDEVIGSMNFRSKALKAYTEQDLLLAERIGMQVAGAIANAQLYDDLKEKELSLRESEERFRLAYSTSPDAININRMSDGLYVDINDGFTRLTGFTREEVIGKTSGEIDIWFHPEDRQKLVRGLNERGYYENLEADFRRKNGSITTALMSARVLLLRDVPHIISITRDISERKRAEEALRESESRFRSYVENAPIGVFICDENGRYLQVNPAATAITGYTSEELLTLSIADILPPESHAPVARHFQVAAETGRVSAEFAFRHKHGKIGMWSLEGVRLSPTRFMGLVTDITERIVAEAEKVNLQGQLLQAQKIESVGRLAGGVAHDFNNMLGLILGHAELALEKVDPTHPLETDLQEIIRAAERSSDITRQLLAFARQQPVTPKVLDLNEALGNMLKMLQRLIGEDIDLKWQSGANLWPVRMDPTQIDQILANLCVNARDAISDTGKITIETGNIVLTDAYCADHAGFVSGEYAKLVVSDDGCGMDRETADKIFEPFFTTKGIGKGTGLGLSTVYGIVKQNNGFINVYSEPGRGTTFTIYLPRHLGKSEQAEAARPQEPLKRGHETILLVEDEPALLELNKTILEKQGYQVLAAGSPTEATRVAGEHRGKIHLLMTDVVMPEMNGRDLAKQLFALDPDLKCLFASGYTADVIAHHGILDEGVHFIQKPFSRKDLAAKVREVLELKSSEAYSAVTK